MYDRGNDLVGRFIDDLMVRMGRFFGAFGKFVVRVRPAKFEYGGEGIQATGVDEFALALFRQGLTTFELSPDIDRDALVGFLEVLSRGMAAGDDQDDDLVTLLWRAELPGVHYTSVLGFEEEGGDDQDKLIPEAVRETLADDDEGGSDDGPGDVSSGVEATFRKKAGLLEQEAIANLPQDLRDLVAPLSTETISDLHPFILEIVGEALMAPAASEHMDVEEARRLLELTLGWLLEAGDLDNVAAFAGFLRFLGTLGEAPAFPYAPAIAAVRRTGMTEEQIRGLVAGLPAGMAEHGKALASVLTTLGRARKATVAALADEARTEESRAVLEGILLLLCQDEPEFLASRFRAAKGPAAVRSLILLARANADLARQALARRLAGGDPDTLAALLGAIPGLAALCDARVREAIASVAAAPGPLRPAAIDLLRGLGAREALDALWSWARSKEFDAWDLDSAAAVLKALVALTPDESALDHVEGLLGRRAWLRRKALDDVKIAAARALGASDARRAYQLLGDFATTGSDELRQACRMAQREITSRRNELARAAAAAANEPTGGGR